VCKKFGGLKALDKVSLDVEENSITGLIGPNGSGKTTLFNIISGFYTRDSGEIYFRGERIDGLCPHEIAVRGLCRTFQISKAPNRMTVLENMLLTPKEQTGEGIMSILFRYGQIAREERTNLRRALSLLELVNLRGLSNEYAGNLSGGQKKLLTLGRILMAGPDLILLDEPTAGVNLTLVKDLLETMKKLRDREGKTLFLVEHNMKVISGICDKVYVLDFGKKIAEGKPEEVQRDERVLEAYLSRARECPESKD
jgi:ABC-type branched-subunit amino acid transport system ATPase component